MARCGEPGPQGQICKVAVHDDDVPHDWQLDAVESAAGHLGLLQRSALRIQERMNQGLSIEAAAQQVKLDEKELGRLRQFEQAIRAALLPGRWRGFNGPDGVSQAEVIEDVIIAVEALDQGRQP